MSNQVSLTDDLLVEILTRLPLKSLSRFKCVSRSWQTLISDNDYLRNKLHPIITGVFQHSNSTRRNEPTCVSTSGGGFEFASLNFFSFRSNSVLIGCCNGLLLFYSSTTTYHVCNPITKKFISLPEPSRKSQLSFLAFDPNHSQHFKVANFIHWHDQGADLELFSSETGNWVEHKICWGLDSNALSATVRYTNGTLYILVHPNQAVAIDLKAMTCYLIRLPEATRNECYVGELGGWLHCSVTDRNQLRVWMLKDKEKGEWTLKHCVCVRMGKCRVVALHPEREVVYLVMADQKLVSYNVCEERVDDVWELGEEMKGYLVGVWVFPFTKYMEDALASRDS